MYYHYNYTHTYIIFKQTIRTSGGNLTYQHTEDVSLAVLFLMEAAKRADSMLGASRQTTAHTIRDASTDVLKMARDLMAKQTPQEIKVHIAPTFIDNSDVGWKKLATTTWLKDVLSKKLQQEESAYTYTNSEREVDIGYEISHVV